MSAIGIGLLILAHAADYVTFLVMVVRHGLGAEANPIVARRSPRSTASLLLDAGQGSAVLLVASIFLVVARTRPGWPARCSWWASCSVASERSRTSATMLSRGHPAAAHPAPARLRRPVAPSRALDVEVGAPARTQSRTAHSVVQKARPCPGDALDGEGPHLERLAASPSCGRPRRSAS